MQNDTLPFLRSNTATSLQPWQQNIFDKIVSGGVKPGEMMIMSAGRRVGKSALTAQAIERLMRDINSRPVEELVLSESKLHGACYYCVEPVGGNWLDMQAWVTEVFGEPGDVWPMHDFTWPEVPRWVQNHRKFWFRNERDRTVFILKWSR